MQTAFADRSVFNGSRNSGLSGPSVIVPFETPARPVHGFIGRRELKESTETRHLVEGNAISFMDTHALDTYFTRTPSYLSEPQWGHNLPVEWALGVRSPNTGLITFEWFVDAPAAIAA